MYKRELDELNRLRVENARLNADMAHAAENITEIIDGVSLPAPDNWAGWMYAVRDEIAAHVARAETAERERDAILKWAIDYGGSFGETGKNGDFKFYARGDGSRSEYASTPELAIRKAAGLEDDR